jgi:hypothetical protein
MATKRLDYPIDPMDLANMRQNGVRSLEIMCHHCQHKTVMNVDHLRGTLTVKSFEPRMVCRNAEPSTAKSTAMSPA